ncbi:aminotransferase class V-fold PLP-dependent enzyme [Burkholderia sp. RS01]|uniref:aminotransferase class V-fold PLP-dependent enzyme n=1 Tax=unclassified Burkholderia TaxID=2613784 RepID=UPI003218B37C
MHAVDIRRLFPGLHDIIYLNTASINVGRAPARAAYELAVERWSAGRFDWTEAEQAGEDARAIFAEIVGARAGEIAIVPAVSTAAGIIAANLPSAKFGENIVVAENEFASNYFPWLLLRERGYEVRTVAPGGDGVSVQEVRQAVDGGTRPIAVSAVHSANGYRADLAAIGRVAAESGAWFFVDACQAAGAVPLDVVRDGVDFLSTCRWRGFPPWHHRLRPGQTPMRSWRGSARQTWWSRSAPAEYGWQYISTTWMKKSIASPSSSDTRELTVNRHDHGCRRRSTRGGSAIACRPELAPLTAMRPSSVPVPLSV